MLIETLLIVTTLIDNLGLSSHATSGPLSKYYELYEKSKLLSEGVYFTITHHHRK